MTTLVAANEGQDSANEKIVAEFITIIPFNETSQKELITQLEQLHTVEEKTEFLFKVAQDTYVKREEQVGSVVMRQVEKFVTLSVIDNLWMNHLDAMDNLRQGIGLRGYAQKDPLVEYKNEGYRMFEQLMWRLDDEIVHRIYKVQVQQQGDNPPHGAPGHVHTKPTHKHADGSVHQGLSHEEQPVGSQKSRKMITNTPESEVSESPKQASQPEEKHKLGRNDPCWCGSGKKWKKCHYPQLA